MSSLYSGLAAWGNILIVPLSLIPLLLNLWYYYKTRIFDYLLLSLTFLIWTIFQGFSWWYMGFNLGIIVHPGYIGMLNPTFEMIYFGYIDTFVATIDALPLLFVALRAKYGSNLTKYPAWINLLWVGILLFNVVGVVDQFGTIFITAPLYGWAIWASRFVCHILIMYVFLTSLHSNEKKANLSRWLWILSSFFWAFAMIGFMVPVGFLGYNFLFGDIPLIFDFWPNVSYLIGASLMLYNHIVNPESVLITHRQIHRALRLYKEFEVKEEGRIDFRMPRIRLYLDVAKDEISVTPSLDS